MMIGVIGGDPCSESEAVLAYETGREIGGRGHTLVCGGRGGAMREACRGARERGGHTIGILPGDSRAEANEFVEFAIPTGLGHARNLLVVRSADALVAIGGRYGTLSELAFALIHGRPIAGLGTWELVDPGGQAAPVVPFDTPADAIDYCEQFATKE
ncbi:MAG: TIGR00725 family protein [Hyphomicrobiales bacterium]